MSKRKLNLDILKKGLPGVSKAMGAILAEAAMVCLAKNGHHSSIEMKVTGDFEETFEVIWSDKVNIVIDGTWQDLKEATEFGATGIALLLIDKLTEYHAFERSKGEAFDYYLKKNFVNYQQNKKEGDIALLEISGIWEEKKGNTINRRINLKKKQVQNIPIDMDIYILVTEFSFPKVKIIKK